jgi:hypothetical protein
MKGLELSRHFYFECVQPIIATHFPQLMDSHAAGLLGFGSDVLGNDDALSRDHEWGPRLVLFLQHTEHSDLGRELDRTIQEFLPATCCGFPTRFLREEKWGSLVMTTWPSGQHHVEITTVPRFLERYLGTQRIPESDIEWLLIPEQRLLEVTAGQVFYDPVGEIGKAREKLSYYPENVWKYRLSYVLESLGWELDLVPLCGKRGDMVSMHLNTGVTVARVIKLAFLVNRSYGPGYAKWLQREFSKLEIISEEMERTLETALVSRDVATVRSSINQVLDELYVHLRTQEGLPELPVQFPRVETRGSSVIDTQRIARAILGSISGPLRGLSLHGAPLGMADQWITNEDILTSPEYMAALATVCEKDASLRLRYD